MNRDFKILVYYRTYRIRSIQALSLQKMTKLANKALKFFQTKNVPTFTGKQPLDVFEFLALFVITTELGPTGERKPWTSFRISSKVRQSRPYGPRRKLCLLGDTNSPGHALSNVFFGLRPRMATCTRVCKTSIPLSRKPANSNTN